MISSKQISTTNRSRRPIQTLITVACLLVVGSTSFAQQAATPTRPAGKLIEIKVPAPSLKGNLLGDPTEQDVAIYLPPSYESAPAKRYAVVYLLHGFIGSYKMWTSNEFNLQVLMNDMIGKGKVPEMIVVGPNGWNSYKGAFYTNSTVNGNWEDYIYRDIVQYIDGHYRTFARAESRGIAGHSMGGYGALTLAMKHPDVFGAVYALSPCCLGIEGDFSADNPAWLPTLRLTSKEQLNNPPKSFGEFYQLAFIGLAAALSPNPSHTPLLVDLPYQERNGRVEKNEPVYERWRSKMPVYMVEDNKSNLLKLRGIFFDYGQNEEFSHIKIATQQFSRELSNRSIPHVFEIYESGTHNSKIRQRLETRLLPFFAEKLDFGSSN